MGKSVGEVSVFWEIKLQPHDRTMLKIIKQHLEWLLIEPYKVHKGRIL